MILINPVPTHDWRCDQFPSSTTLDSHHSPFSCFSLGLRLCPSTATVLRTVSPPPSTRAEMNFFRSWSEILGFGSGQKVAVEAVNGFAVAGEDVFDSGSPKVSPDHLVIMVNGIIGRILA